jgi:hypothetical protein
LFCFYLGFLSKLERATHIDFNRDNIIGRVPDVYYQNPGMYGPGFGGYPSMNSNYGGYPSMGYGYGPMNNGFY